MAGGALRGHIEAMRAAGLPVPNPLTLGTVMQHEDYADSLALLPVEAPVAAQCKGTAGLTASLARLPIDGSALGPGAAAARPTTLTQPRVR